MVMLDDILAVRPRDSHWFMCLILRNIYIFGLFLIL